MQQIVLFFLLFFLIIGISFAKPAKEGFTNFFGYNFTQANEGTPPPFNTKNGGLPLNQPPTPELAEAGVGNIEPSPPPASNLPSAPFGLISKQVPRPYRNPTMEPAKLIQILALKEDLQAFFGFQAPQFESTSDPSIQMPLTRARADMKELIDVASVMERNPGLPSRVTNKTIEEMRSNLRYLQAMLRDMKVSGAIEGTEGFADMDSDDEDSPATKEDLKEFRTRVWTEIKRLSASGTTDPLTQGRINTLEKIKQEITEILDKLEDGRMTPETVPISKKDLEKALPNLGSPTAPLPNLLKKAGLPPAIQNLFPGGMSPADAEQSTQINNIVQGYMKDIFEGTSWGVDLGAKVNLQYDSPRAVQIRGHRPRPNVEGAEVDTGVPGVTMRISKYDETETTPSDVKQSCGNTYTPAGRPNYEFGLPGSSRDRVLPPIRAGGLDWKVRSHQICDQVRKRGMDPLVFGAMPPGAEVSEDFNWKGYTRMLCKRLESTADPGLPITVGCPEQNWDGWKETV